MIYSNYKTEYLINIFRYKERSIILVFMVLISFFITLSTSVIISYFAGDGVFYIDYLDDLSATAVFAITVVFAPLIETFLYQFLIIEVLLFIRKWIHIPLFIPITVSAIAFGMSHDYNVYYICSASLIGILYAIFYLIAKYNVSMNAFISVTIVHASTNFMGFMLDQIR